MSKIVLRFCHSPHGNALAQDGLDFALAATNYGHDVVIVFESEGVLQLLQASEQSDHSSFSKRLSVMPMFDIEECYACTHSLETYGVTPGDKLVQTLDLKNIDAAAKLALFEQSAHTVTF